MVKQVNTHNKYSFIVYLYQSLLFIDAYILTKEILSADTPRISMTGIELAILEISSRFIGGLYTEEVA